MKWHGLLDKHPSQSSIEGLATEERVYKQREIYNFFGKNKGGLFFWWLSQGSYGGFHLSVYYQMGQDQGHIRNKCVVQTQMCPLLVYIEMNRSSCYPGAWLTRTSKQVYSTMYRWSTREVLPEQVSCHYPAATQVLHWLTGKSKQVYPTVQDHVCRYSSDPADSHHLLNQHIMVYIIIIGLPDITTMNI